MTNELSKDIRSFINQNLDLIDQNNWEEFYEKVSDEFPLSQRNTFRFTEIFLGAGINPLNYLRVVPKYYLRNSQNISKIELPENVCIIDNNAFRHMLSVKELRIPKNITVIGQGAFANCYNLKEVVIEAIATRLPSHCFSGCSTLEKVHLPKNITDIDLDCFASCEKLKTIYYQGTKMDFSKVLWISTPPTHYTVICSDGEIEL